MELTNYEAFIRYKSQRSFKEAIKSKSIGIIAIGIITSLVVGYYQGQQAVFDGWWWMIWLVWVVLALWGSYLIDMYQQAESKSDTGNEMVKDYLSRNHLINNLTLAEYAAIQSKAYDITTLEQFIGKTYKDLSQADKCELGILVNKEVCYVWWLFSEKDFIAVSQATTNKEIESILNASDRVITFK